MGKRGGQNELGQATVELAVVLPAAIIVAVIAVNALTFFGTCASFDRVARQSVCAWVAVPEANMDVGDAATYVRDELERAVGASNIAVSVSAEHAAGGLTKVVARIEYQPTLFGLGLRREVFGVSLPPLVHEVALAVDAYKPGILF